MALDQWKRHSTNKLAIPKRHTSIMISKSHHSCSDTEETQNTPFRSIRNRFSMQWAAGCLCNSNVHSVRQAAKGSASEIQSNDHTQSRFNWTRYQIGTGLSNERMSIEQCRTGKRYVRVKRTFIKYFGPIKTGREKNSSTRIAGDWQRRR